MKKLLKEMSIIHDIQRFDKVGGRKSIFGLLHIFEGELKDLHNNEITEEELKENYPFVKWKGMNCYGNIIQPRLLRKAYDNIIKKYKFTKLEFEKIVDWYENTGSIDCIFCAFFIKEYFKGNYTPETTGIKNEQKS